MSRGWKRVGGTQQKEGRGLQESVQSDSCRVGRLLLLSPVGKDSVRHIQMEQKKQKYVNQSLNMLITGRGSFFLPANALQMLH